MSSQRPCFWMKQCVVLSHRNCLVVWYSPREKKTHGSIQTDLSRVLPKLFRNNFRTEWRQPLDTGHGIEEDSIHQLDRATQVTIFRLRTGHCQLLSYLHRLKISHSDECPCGTGNRTHNHILQSCPTFGALRRQTWPSPVGAPRKLWGPVETLQQTPDFALLNGLKI